MTWRVSAIAALTAVLPLAAGGPGASPSPGSGQFAVFGPTAKASPASPSATKPTASVPAQAPAGPPTFSPQVEWPLVSLRAYQLWRHGLGGGENIAVVDTGIDVQQLDLAGAVSRIRDLTARPRESGADESADSHGTAIAGIIAARGSRASQPRMAGLAPRAMLFDIRVAVEPGRVTSAAIAQGIVTAVRAGAAIINVSLLAPSLDPELGEAVTFAQARGCLIVAAGGNATAVQALTGYPGVLTVAAVNQAGALLGVGPASVSAPGADLFSAGETHPVRPGAGYVYGVSGSDFAAAYVSAAAALLLSADRKLTPAAAGRLLVSKARHTADSPVSVIDPLAALDSTLPAPPAPAGGRGSPALTVGLPVAGGVLIVILLTRIRAVRRRRATRLALAAIPHSSWDQPW